MGKIVNERGEHMKIGEFAEEKGISKDTVRHYMDIGLIVPEKDGGQYNFDEACSRSLEEVFLFKDMGFTLNEIKTIFIFRRLGRLTPYQEMEYYSRLFTDKYKSIVEDMEKLQKAKSLLEEKISTHLEGQEKDPAPQKGMEMEFLDLLACSGCGGKLVLNEGQIVDNRIVQGLMHCACGKTYVIEDGILILETYRQESGFTLLVDYLGEYIQVTDAEYLENVYKSMEWVRQRIAETDLSGKNILELGSGLGFALRNILNDLPDSCRYIAVDRDISRLKFLKRMIEGSGRETKFLFICTDFKHIPLRKGSVDLLMDISGSSNYNFESEDFLLEALEPLLKTDAGLLGTYIIFRHFGADSQIPENLRKNFLLENLKKRLESMGFIPEKERLSDALESGGRFEDYFVPGERVSSYQFFGKR